MVGLEGLDPTEVEATETFVSDVLSMTVSCRRCALEGWVECPESCACVGRISVAALAPSGGEGGRHKAHSRGRT